jgi:hypothetical protein
VLVVEGELFEASLPVWVGLRQECNVLDIEEELARLLSEEQSPDMAPITPLKY